MSNVNKLSNGQKLQLLRKLKESGYKSGYASAFKQLRTLGDGGPVEPTKPKEKPKNVVVFAETPMEVKNHSYKNPQEVSYRPGYDPESLTKEFERLQIILDAKYEEYFSASDKYINEKDPNKIALLKQQLQEIEVERDKIANLTRATWYNLQNSEGLGINWYQTGLKSDTFIKEGEDLKKFYQRTNPAANVDIRSIYGPDEFEKNISTIPAGTELHMYGHYGNMLFGTPIKDVNAGLQDAPLSACYTGSCYGEDLKNKGLFDNLQYPAYGTIENQWIGVNPNASNLRDAMFSTQHGDNDLVATIKTPIPGKSYRNYQNTTSVPNANMKTESQQMDEFHQSLFGLTKMAEGGSVKPPETNPVEGEPITPTKPPEKKLIASTPPKPAAKKYSNVVEKQEYWDGLEYKYGKGVKNRQVYLDLYTKQLPPLPESGTIYKLWITAHAAFDPDNSSFIKVTNDKISESRKKLIGEYNKELKDLEFEQGKVNNPFVYKAEIGPPNSKLLDDKKALAEELARKYRLQWNNTEEDFMENSTQIEVTDYNTWKDVFDAADVENPALLYASLMDEGADGYTANTFDFDTAFLNGFAYFGLDRVYDYLPKLIDKGYLEKDFMYRLTPSMETNEKKERVISAEFADYSDIVKMKNAMFKLGKDEVNSVASSNSIKLSKKGTDYWTLVYYNYGPNGMRNMLKVYQNKGYLKNDAYLNSNFTPESYSSVHRNAIRRIQTADMLVGEGLF